MLVDALQASGGGDGSVRLWHVQSADNSVDNSLTTVLHSAPFIQVRAVDRLCDVNFILIMA